MSLRCLFSWFFSFCIPRAYRAGACWRQTDVDGQWVHVVCSLYTDKVFWGDEVTTSPVILQRIPPQRWSAKACMLCKTPAEALTGVTIGCDAGMCKGQFHVSCAQSHGLLKEAGPDDDIADPYYAYCPTHADKLAARALRRKHEHISKLLRSMPPPAVVRQRQLSS